MEWTDFLHAGANLGKLKVISLIFGWVWSEWAWSFSSWDSKICWMNVWIKMIFCILTVMRQFLVRPTSCSISLTFKCQSTAVVLVRPPPVAGRILWNRVSQSVLPVICLGVFLELDHRIYLNFGMMRETLMKLCMTAQFFGKTFLPPKLGKWAKKKCQN